MMWVDGVEEERVKGVGLFIGSILEFCRSPLRSLPPQEKIPVNTC